MSKKDNSCMFEVVPHECTWCASGKCVALQAHKLRCVYNHLYSVVKPEMVDYVVGMLREELVNKRRTIGGKEHAIT